MAADLQPVIDEIETTKGVIDSAIALINGIAGRIQAAIDAALANGATAEQLQPVVDEAASLKTKADELAAAVAANP